MRIYVKKVEGVVLPQQGSQVASGYDIVATSDPQLVGENYESLVSPKEGEPLDWKRIEYIQYETNLYIAPETLTHHVLIHPRSSVSKYNLVLANSIGLIDNDYRGQVLCRFKYIWQPEDLAVNERTVVGVVNTGKIYKKGDKIAQLVVEPTIHVEWLLRDDLTATNRGEGGFGSTDQMAEQGAPSSLPTIPTREKSTLAEMYQDAGGIPIKSRYIDEVKRRQQDQP